MTTFADADTVAFSVVVGGMYPWLLLGVIVVGILAVLRSLRDIAGKLDVLAGKPEPTPPPFGERQRRDRANAP